MGRSFLICDSEGHEKCWLPDTAELDFEIGGDSSDVQLTIEEGIVENGDFLICPGTEYGAVLEELQFETGSNVETWLGNSFRKLLDQVIICPDPGQDYKVVTGDANSVLQSLLSGKLGNFFQVQSTEAGLTVRQYQFQRYCTALVGLTDMLSAIKAKLKITIESGPPNGPFSVVLKAVPVVNWSDTYEWSEDSKLTVSVSENRRGINHLICLGQGELKDRQILHLYRWPDGSVKDKPYYQGFAERQEVYDYSSADSLDELRKGGIQRLQEIGNSLSASVQVGDVELDIGDIVSARSYKKGISVQVPIVSKLIKIQDGKMTVEYQTEGE